jgi:hypothetical protein
VLEHTRTISVPDLCSELVAHLQDLETMIQSSGTENEE